MQVYTNGQAINEKSSYLDGISFKRVPLYISGQIINGSSSNLDKAYLTKRHLRQKQRYQRQNVRF